MDQGCPSKAAGLALAATKRSAKADGGELVCCAEKTTISFISGAAKCAMDHYNEREDCESDRRRMKTNTENVTGNRPNLDRKR